MRVAGTGTGAEAAELARGISLGVAARPQPGPARTDGETVTLLWSWWNHLRCRTCGHTFRRGDRVRVSRRGNRVVHLVPGLGCGTPASAGPGGAAELAAFRAGLLSAWPPPPGVRLQQIEQDDWRLPDGPGDLRDSNVCLQCGHTLRPGETVVVCPCRPLAPPGPDTGPGASAPARPAACGRAVHRDPVAGLSCWESWRPDGRVTVCPVTQTAVGGVGGVSG